MAGILRELLAHFAVSVDVRPLSEMDRKIEKLKGNLREVAAIATAAFGAAAYATYTLVDAASSANEALNVLNQTFKAQAPAVLAWSRTMARELGRSEFTLQDSVGRFGAFLGPTLKGTGVDIAAMSEQLSTLAVDLASFYNTSDEEAQMRLFSGMSGETEAVRRLGIDISDTSLDALNKSRGDNRRLAQMTLAEKSQLRFLKIIQDTVDKQGDAKRTADQWANSLKRLQGILKTISVNLGRRIIEPLTEMLHGVEAAVVMADEVMTALIDHTSTLQTVLGMTGAAMAYFAAQATLAAMWAVAFLPAGVIAAAALYGLKLAAIAASFLVIEDVVTFLRGGDSLTGRMLEDVTGLKEPLDAVAELWTGIKNDVSDTAKILSEFMRLTVLGLRMLAMAGTLGGSEYLLQKYGGAKGITVDDLKYKAPELSSGNSFIQDTATGLGLTSENTTRDTLDPRQQSWDDHVKAGDMNRAANSFRRPGESFPEAVERAKSEREQMILNGQVQATPEDVAGGLPAGPAEQGHGRYGMSTGYGVSTAPSAPQMSMPSAGDTKTMEVNIYMSGGDSSDVASKVREVMQSEYGYTDAATGEER